MDKKYIAITFIMSIIIAQSVLQAFSIDSSGIRAEIDESNGCVISFGPQDGEQHFATADKYVLDGKNSVESQDKMNIVSQSPDRLVLEGSNASIGLKLKKEYYFDAGELVKKVTYGSDSKERILFEASGRTKFTEKMCENGYFFMNIDDGYKVQTLPFIPIKRITTPTGWQISRGALIFYSPEDNITIAHYRHRINGRFYYGESNKTTESKLLPDGAITALCSDFICADRNCVFESRFMASEGDPRTYLNRVYTRKPFSSFKGRSAPEWFKNTIMFFPEYGDGEGLVNYLEANTRYIKNILDAMPQDQYLLLFFNHWSTSGYYPAKGTIRHLRGTQWSDPIPVERMKAAIDAVKAISPRIKFGAYFFFAPVADSPIAKEHPEWFIHNSDGQIEQGGDGIGECYHPDFSSGYREYLLQQLKDAVDYYGMDWLHLDAFMYENTNYLTKNVVQTADWAELYWKLSEFTKDKDVAIIQNVAWSNLLWSDGTYFECQQPDRWEKKDWRIMGTGAYLAAMARTQRPGVWSNLCYGTLGAWGLRNTFCGMKGWVRGTRHWWLELPASLEHESVVSELLQTQLADTKVSPDWWKMETSKLEILPLKAGNSLLLTMLEHDDNAVTEKITCAPQDTPGAVENAYFFRRTVELREPEPLQLTAGPVPPIVEPIKWLAFTAEQNPQEQFQLEFSPKANTYCVQSYVPAWVYSANGRRTAIPLPELNNVSLEGYCAPGASSYQIKSFSKAANAEAMLWLPQEWQGCIIQSNGQAITYKTFEFLGQTLALVSIPQGEATFDIANAENGMTKQAYQPYTWPHWQQMVHRLQIDGPVLGEAKIIDGRTCMTLANGRTEMRLYGTAFPCEAIIADMLGSSSGASMEIEAVNAKNETYKQTFKDDFAGWRTITMPLPDDIAANFTHLCATISGGLVTIGNLHLKPGTVQEDSTSEQRRIIARRTETPITVSAKIGPEWKKNDIATAFFHISTDKIADGNTEVRVSYDDKYLYLLAENFEPISELGETGKRDSQIWSKDHFELFIKPHPETQEWFQIMVDPAKTIEDMQYTDLGQSEAWQGVFDVDTALNWKVSWNLMMRIPYSTLNTDAPKEGDVWSINFARLDLAGEWSNWGTTTGDWLDASKFGLIVFGNSEGIPPRPDALVLHAQLMKNLRPETAPTGCIFAPVGNASFSPDGLVTTHKNGVKYSAIKNFKSTCGTIAMDITPSWTRFDDKFHHFLKADINGFDLILYRFGNWDSIIAFSNALGLSATDIPQIDMDDSWTKPATHRLAFTWDNDSAILYLDGRTTEQKVKKAPQADITEFNIGGPYFVPNDTSTAISNLKLFSRKMTVQELNDLWK